MGENAFLIKIDREWEEEKELEGAIWF